MFQRLQKGFNLDFLDNKIAEEQEKQKNQHQQPPSRAGSASAKRTTGSASGAARRTGARTDSPSKRPSSRLRASPEHSGDGGDSRNSPAIKGPDPDSFVIGDDVSDFGLSRTATPVVSSEGDDHVVVDEKAKSDKEDVAAAAPAEVPVRDNGKKRAEQQDELSLEVRQKLAKLETLTTRYQDLLRNYRTAHAHVAAIEPFEATLREHTPLTSIADPGALVEFLNQRSLQSDMVMQELKRVSGEHKEAVRERDELKIKLDVAEQKAKEAFDEAAGLRRKRDEETSIAVEKTDETADSLAAKSDVTSSKKDDDAFFSYEEEVSRVGSEDQGYGTKIRELETAHEAETTKLKDAHKTLVSELTGQHEAELSKLQDELKEQQAYVDELSTENASIRHNLDITQADLDAMENEQRDREDNIVRELEVELEETKSQLEQAVADREVAQRQEEEATASLAYTEREVINLQHQLKQYQEGSNGNNEMLADKAIAADLVVKQHEQDGADTPKNVKSAKLGAKQLGILQNLVNTLRDQVKTAEQSKTSTESKVNDLQFEIKKLESEISSSSAIIAQLRRHEAAAADLNKRISEAEHERDEARRLADTKKGHEAAVASLRSQLKRAEKERDAAYQMILDCGKCKVPEHEKGDVVETLTEESFSTPETRSRLGSQSTEASTLPTEISTPSTPIVDGNEQIPPGDFKKKNKKKKSKAKKKAPGEAATTQSQPDLTLDDLLRDPELAPDVLLKARFGDNPMVPLFANIVESAREKDEAKHTEKDSLLQHHEAMIEELKQNIINKDVMLKAKNEDIIALQESKAMNLATSESNAQKDKEIDQLRKEIVTLKLEISEKDEQIRKLQDRLQGEASLLDNIELLQEDKASLEEDILEHGKAATDAKHELKELKIRRDELQQAFDKLQQESDEYRKKMKDESAEKDHLSSRCRTLETEIEDLSGKTVNNEELDKVREQLHNVEKEKESLQVAKEACEGQIEELKLQHSASGAELGAKHQSLSTDFEMLRSKAAETEKELAAAHQLAQTRFKDLTIVRDQYNKLQPELKKLREEFAELKTTRSELEKANSSIKRLEAKEKDLRSEIAEYKAQAGARDREVSTLKEEAKKSNERSTALEESYEKARKDLERSESTRNEAVEKREKLMLDFKSVEDELRTTKSSLDDLDQKARKFSEEASGLRDELQLRSAQQESAQSLMDSMQDQTRELTTRMKEAEDRRGGLEEELADAHRLLSERGREGETMRRLLADVEGRADTKVKEMREQMELALQERDRAEDEASTIGRRKAREIEELKTKLRDAEREANRATEARQNAERQEVEYKSRQEDLERRASQAQEEVNEIRTAMAQLRDTLDETEQQSRALEKNKLDLKKTIDERDSRLEKLQKSSRSMAEELRALQAASKVRQSGNATPSRSSMESPRVTSPLPRQSNGAAPASKDGGVDFVYLKNILLQFLEQKEKKYQMQLIPVLGMILHFDKQEEQKWLSVISAK